MTTSAHQLIQEVTRELNADQLQDYVDSLQKTRYRPIPETADPESPFWRVRLDLAFDIRVHIGLDVYGEIALGRGKDDLNFVGLLAEEDAARLGVSRRHALLRPAPGCLYLIDPGSTNGTRLNGHPIGVNIPYRLHDRDTITFGQLDFTIRIIQTPEAPAAAPSRDLLEVIPGITAGINGSLERDEILAAVIAQVEAATSADAVAIWLVDEQTGELYLETSSGGETSAPRIPSWHQPARQVIQTGTLMLNRSAVEGRQAVSTVYAPIKLGGVTFGVLAASHQAADRAFDARDQRFIEFIAQTAAVAIQNARLYQTRKEALQRSRRIMALMNDALNYSLKGMINQLVGYTGLLRDQFPEDDETTLLTAEVLGGSEALMQYLEQLITVLNLHRSDTLRQDPCDLVEITRDACNALQTAAVEQRVRLDFELTGYPVLVTADPACLYRAVTGLIDNGICHAPRDSTVWVRLSFYGTSAVVTVMDSGLPLPEDDPAHLFDRYGGGLRGGKDDSRLAISLEITYATARAYRGSLSAENLPDGGVMFSFKLPAQSGSRLAG